MKTLGTRAPAAVAALALAAGAFLARGVVPRGVLAHPWTLAVTLLLALPAAVNLVCDGTGRARPALATEVALLAALVAAGGTHCVVHRSMVPREHVAASAVSGRVSVRVRVNEVRCSASGATNVVANALEVDGVPAEGPLWVSWPRGALRPGAGDVAALEGVLSAPEAARNPGAFDFASWLRSRGVHRTLRSCAIVALDADDRRVGPADWVSATIRRRVPGVSGELLVGLLLGRTRELPDELSEAFRRSGTVHVLAVSGLHVGFVVLIAHAVLRSLRVPRRAALALVLPVLVGFVAVVGPRPSVVRASLMAAFLMLAPLIERASCPINSLGAAAIVLMIARPGCLSDLGFQLSFSAVIGILLLHEPLARAMRSVIERVAPAAGRFSHWTSAALALSLSAQAGVAPVLVGTFGRLSLISPVANLAAVPLAGLSVASGTATLAFDALGTWPSAAFGAVAWSSCSLLAAVTGLLGAAPWSSVGVATRFWPATLGAVAGLSIVLRARTHRARGAGGALVAAAVAAAVVLSVAGPGRSYPRVVLFDVGQGDSVLLELPRRQYVLVDAGPGPGTLLRYDDNSRAEGSWRPRDLGAAVVVPYLEREAIGRLRMLVVTHAHADHYGGVASVLAAVRVDTLALPPGRTADPRLASIVELARKRRTRVVEVARGRTMAFGSTSVRVLSPEREFARRCSENDASVVLSADLAGGSVLLTGDIEDAAEGRLLGARGIAADLLKVPHHGSDTSSTTEFLGRVLPSLAVVQTGEGNRHGHPGDDALGRIRRAGALVARTDLDGAVVVDFCGGSMKARCVLSGRELSFEN